MAVSDRIMRILGAFEDARSPLTLKDIADTAGLPMSTTHRLVGELVATGALNRDEDRRYVVGLRLFAIGARAAAYQNRGSLLPDLVALHNATRRTVVYSVPDGAMFRAVEVIHVPTDDPGVRAGGLIAHDLTSGMLNAGLYSRTGRLRGVVSLLGGRDASMRASAAVLEASVSRMSRVIRYETMTPDTAIRRAG
jgi:hypothetical protein